MKKLLTLTLAGIIALSMAACSPNAKNDGVQSMDSIGGDKPSSSDANSNKDDSNKPLSFSSQMGKVTSIVGNEIEINLIKEPEMPTPEEGGMKIEGDMTAAVAMVPAVSGGKPVAGGAKERDDIELTGEIKTYIIPAGMPIKDAMHNEKQLTDIKKGALLNVLVDAQGNITEVFLYE